MAYGMVAEEVHEWGTTLERHQGHLSLVDKMHAACSRSSHDVLRSVELGVPSMHGTNTFQIFSILT